jgi:hypothetical protein
MNIDVNMRRWLVAITFGVMTFVLRVNSLHAETWSDSTGKFKIEAEYAGIEGKSVVLRKSDGKSVKVPIANLSPESREQAKALYTKSKALPPTSATTASSSGYQPKVRKHNFTPPVPPTIPPMASFPDNATLQDTLDHVRKEALAGHLEVFWVAMPDELRATADSTEIRDALRPHMKNNMAISAEMMGVLDKLTEVLVTKKPFIIGSPMLAQVPPQIKPMVEQAYDPAVGVVYEYCEASVAAESLADTSLTSYINHHLPRIGAHLQSLLKVVPTEMTAPFIDGVVAEQTDENTGKITWPKQDGTTESTEMVRYNNRWLPKDLAEKWQADKDTFVEKMVANASTGAGMVQNDPNAKAMIESVVTQANAMLDPLLAAKSQQEFDFAMGQVMMPIMMMMGGGGPGGAFPPGPPGEQGPPPGF